MPGWPVARTKKEHLPLRIPPPARMVDKLEGFGGGKAILGGGAVFAEVPTPVLRLNFAGNVMTLIRDPVSHEHDQEPFEAELVGGSRHISMRVPA
jgi:hypothetical protein